MEQIIVIRDQYEEYPLSSMQHGMLFHSVSEPTSGVYVQQKILRLSENLDRRALEEAWQRLVERHSILRTRFQLDGSQGPVQQVLPDVTTAIQQEDWRSLSKSEQQRQMEAFLLCDRRRGFDFDAGPPMRLVLFRLAELEYQLVWTSHHALLDGRSYVLVLTELFQLYHAIRDGNTPQLPALRPYRDYIDWLSGQDFGTSEQFWRRTLAGFEAPTPLVVDQIRTVLSHEEVFGKQSVVLSTGTAHKLQSVAAERGATLNNCVQASWALLLSRYSGLSEVLFGTTRACRSFLEGAREMVGLFINTLPFRANPYPELTVAEFLQHLRAQHVALRKVEHTPLAAIQKWSPFSAQEHLFESVVVFEASLVNSLLHQNGPAWEHREFRLEERTNYPLTLSAYQDDGLILKLGYDRRRFADVTIARMLGHLRTLLQGIADNQQTFLKDLPLLTNSERKTLLVDWNQTEEEYPRHKPVHELFEQQVERSPDASALICESTTLSYRDLNRRANRLASQLRELGIGPDVLVGIVMERCPELMVAILGVLKAGGAYLPLDPLAPKQRLAFMLRDARADFVIVQPKLRGKLREIARTVVALDGDVDVFEEHDVNPTTSVTPENLVYVIYTSGSTGTPKGVMIRHRGLVNYLSWCTAAYRVDEGGGCPLYSQVFFDMPVTALFAPLMVGRAVDIIPEQYGSDSLKVAMQRGRDFSLVKITPTHLELLSMQLSADELAGKTRFFVIGGENLSARNTTFWEQTSPDTMLVNEYGPTETVVGCCVYFVPHGEHTRGSIPIGRPIANTRLYAVDALLRPVPVGVPGELLIGGDGVARGYLNRPELTAEKFIADPFSNRPDSRLYRSGDLVRRLECGNLEFLGRVDQQVKIRGYRIELGEIESVLAQHPTVEEAAVTVDETSSGNKRLVAYVVPAEAHSISGDRLREYLLGQLPQYMVPATFQTLDHLPMTPSGKVDRKSLPKPEQASDSDGAVPARDALESELVSIWEDLLDFRPIGIHDNFFESGGDSLLAMRLMIQIKKRFGRDFPELSIYQAPTVAKLAKVIRRSKGPNASPTSVVVPIRTGGNRQPFFLTGLLAGRLVHNLAEHLPPNRPFYAILTKQLGDNIYYGETVQMASQLIEEIKSIQPVGPYFLGTFCNQGPVVLEMAQQLLAQGERVGLLAMIEAAAPGKRTLSYRFRRRIYRDYHRVKAQCRNLTQLPMQERPGYLLGMAVNSVKRQTKSLRRRQQRLAYYAYRWLGRPVPKKLRNSKAVSATLHRRYIPKPYPGRITVFLGQMAQFFHDRTLGWSEFATGGIEIHVTPGNHTDMLRNPNVTHLGRSLERCLERAEAELADSRKPAGTVSEGSEQTEIPTAISDSG